MLKRIKDIVGFWWEVITKFVTDNGLNYSGSIAFFTIFSLPGILIGVVLMTSPIFGEEEVEGELHNQIQTLVGDSSAQQVDTIIYNLESAEFDYTTLIIAICTLLYGSTSVFASIQDGMHVILGIRSKPKQIALKFLLNRLLSFAMIVTIGFLLLISLSADMILVFFKNRLVSLVGEQSMYLVSFAQNISFILIVFIVFVTVYKFLADAIVLWKDVIRGALLATGLFMIGKYLFGFYIGNTSIGTAYGAAGSLVFLLIWVYYSAMILLFGVEFIEVYTRRRERVIKPATSSVKIVVNEVGL